MLLLPLTLLAMAAQPPTMQDLATRLQASPAWEAQFEQRYLPAGFDEGDVDRGAVIVAAPRRVRFDYTGREGRVFAFDGEAARMVDREAGSCDAFLLDAASADRLPLAVLVDPGRTGELFHERVEGTTLVLVPRTPNPDLAELRVVADADGLPLHLELVDGAGNRNQFSFTGWRRREAPDIELFRPALPGVPPCQPHGG